jgi:hypothetical protein
MPGGVASDRERGRRPLERSAQDARLMTRADTRPTSITPPPRACVDEQDKQDQAHRYHDASSGLRRARKASRSNPLAPSKSSSRSPSASLSARSDGMPLMLRPPSVTMRELRRSRGHPAALADGCSTGRYPVGGPREGIGRRRWGGLRPCGALAPRALPASFGGSQLGYSLGGDVEQGGNISKCQLLRAQISYDCADFC